MITMEAMKMEHAIQASSDCTVSEIFVAVGDLIEEGFELMLLETISD